MTKQLPDVVIVGGGFARGLAAARALRNAPAFPTSGQPACHGKERDCDSRERENLRPQVRDRLITPEDLRKSVEDLMRT